MENPLKKITLINASILIAGFSAYVYFCAYRFELGYCSHFNIPDYLIEPGLTTLLGFGATTFSLVLVTMQPFGLTMPLFKKINNIDKPHLKVIYVINACLLLVVIFTFFTFPISWNVYLVVLILIVFTNVTYWVFPTLLVIKSVNPLQAGIELKKESDKQWNIWDRIFGMIGREYIFPLLVVIFFPVLSEAIGSGRAQKQQIFTVFNNHKNIIIVRKYSDILIGCKVDLNRHLVSDSVVLYKLTDNKPIWLSSKNIGPFQEK